MELRDYAACDGVGLATLVRIGDVSAAEVEDVARRAIEPGRSGARRHGRRAFRARARGKRRRPSRGRAVRPEGGRPTPEGAGHPARQPMGRRGSTGVADTHFGQRVRAAGLRVVARTRAPEFAFNATTEPVAHGPTRNPWDLERSVGGSSGGAAALVAARALPIAHATDGGGSIRIPASLCGLVGLKPTRSRIPVGPAIVGGPARDGSRLRPVPHAARRRGGAGCPPRAWRGRQVRHPAAGASLCRRGERRAGPLACSMDRRRLVGRGGRARVPRRRGGDRPCARRARPRRRRRARRRSIPTCFTARSSRPGRRAWPSGRPLSSAASVRLRLPKRSRRARSPCFATEHRSRPSSCSTATATATRSDVQSGRSSTTTDVLLLPSVARPPWKLGELDQNDESLDGDAWVRKLFSVYAPFTAMFNISGQPAISLPLAWSDGDLPDRRAARRALRGRGDAAPPRSPAGADLPVGRTHPTDRRRLRRRRVLLHVRRTVDGLSAKGPTYPDLRRAGHG